MGGAVFIFCFMGKGSMMLFLTTEFLFYLQVFNVSEDFALIFEIQGILGWESLKAWNCQIPVFSLRVFQHI